jgi:hypothetical protein
LADLIKSWKNGDDVAKQDVLVPADKMPLVPSGAHELKGDKRGSSMAEYLQNHHDNCVSIHATAPGVRHSAWSGNTLQNAGGQHVNAFRFACQNFGRVTLATANIDLEQVEFSQQRLYLIAYYFKHDWFELIKPHLSTSSASQPVARKSLPKTSWTRNFPELP